MYLENNVFPFITEFLEALCLPSSITTTSNASSPWTNTGISSSSVPHHDTTRNVTSTEASVRTASSVISTPNLLQTSQGV